MFPNRSHSLDVGACSQPYKFVLPTASALLIVRLCLHQFLLLLVWPSKILWAKYGIVNRNEFLLTYVFDFLCSLNYYGRFSKIFIVASKLAVKRPERKRNSKASSIDSTFSSEPIDELFPIRNCHLFCILIFQVGIIRGNRLSDTKSGNRQVIIKFRVPPTLNLSNPN